MARFVRAFPKDPKKMQMRVMFGQLHQLWVSAVIQDQTQASKNLNPKRVEDSLKTLIWVKSVKASAHFEDRQMQHVLVY